MNSGSSRSYDSPARERQARETRRQIIDAALQLFVSSGYRGTSVNRVAERAGVTAQTVYNAVGTKPQLLKAAWDVTLAGDHEPMALAERPVMLEVTSQTDPVQLLHRYAAVGRTVLDRLGPLMRQIAAGAAAGEPDLVAHQRITDDERLRAATALVARVVALDALADDVTPELARDRIWTLNSVQVWQLLVGDRGWTAREYEDWIGSAMCAAVLRPDLWPAGPATAG